MIDKLVYFIKSTRGMVINKSDALYKLSEISNYHYRKINELVDKVNELENKLKEVKDEK